MAAGTFQFTVGSGTHQHTYIYTRGGTSGHVPYVLEGEHLEASYLANFNNGGAAVSAATANSHLVQVMAGSALRVYIRRIEVYQAAMATTATVANIGVVRLTTAGTGGTAQAVSALDPADAAAGATYMTLPSSKGTESNFIWFGTAYYMQTVGASAQLNQPILAVDFDRPRSKAAVIAAGTANGFALKQITAVAAATVWVNVWLDELNF